MVPDMPTLQNWMPLSSPTVILKLLPIVLPDAPAHQNGLRCDFQEHATHKWSESVSAEDFPADETTVL
jgi:hypothetical protein